MAIPTTPATIRMLTHTRTVTGIPTTADSMADIGAVAGVAMVVATTVVVDTTADADMRVEDMVEADSAVALLAAVEATAAGTDKLRQVLSSALASDQSRSKPERSSASPPVRFLSGTVGSIQFK